MLGKHSLIIFRNIVTIVTQSHKALRIKGFERDDVGGNIVTNSHTSSRTLLHHLIKYGNVSYYRVWWRDDGDDGDDVYMVIRSSLFLGCVHRHLIALRFLNTPVRGG